ncbi:MAG: hypothetical protein ACT4OK_07520 [Gemmobacter sp.]
MTHDRTALEALLDAVHAALRTADFASLPALTAAVGAAGSAMLPDDPAALRLLQRKLQRNEACLQASARGLRAARRRMTEIAAARAGLQTYSRTGERQQIGAAQGALAQRL